MEFDRSGGNNNSTKVAKGWLESISASLAEHSTLVRHSVTAHIVTHVSLFSDLLVTFSTSNKFKYLVLLLSTAAAATD